MVDKFYRITKIAPSPHSVASRLPAVYVKYLDELKKEPAPVHFIPEPGKWKLCPETKQKWRVENRAIPLKFPKEADEGIWGGEGVVQGFVKDPERKRRRWPRFWVPRLKRTVLYSEILNQYMQVTVTERTLRLIDENHGFDNYILRTPVQDLKSQLALSIRRRMILTLLDRETTHTSEKKNEEVYEKYKEFIISREEAEWFGLTMKEAIQKQKLIENSIQPTPLKLLLRQKFIEKLRAQETAGSDEASEEQGSEIPHDDRSTSWLSRLNPFRPKGGE